MVEAADVDDVDDVVDEAFAVDDDDSVDDVVEVLDDDDEVEPESPELLEDPPRLSVL